MQNELNQEPCFVHTSQGFSVSYKNHFLYSKYNPSKVILQTIDKLQILPGTIFLCLSPVLGYGLKELLEKIQKDCLIFLVEADSKLFNFAQKNICTESFSSHFSDSLTDFPYEKKVIHFVPKKELNNLPLKVFNLASCGKYKRIVRLDFSAGTQFFKGYYDNLTAACTNSIMTFWKNRLTLTKFGRHYCYNFFKNLQNLENSVPIKNYFEKIEKPILVFGAGQSIDIFFEKNTVALENFFIICVDTALQPLLKRNVIPDAVFIEEAQSVILKAFIGLPKNKKIHFFAGLSSIPLLNQIVGTKNISYFATEFTKASFFDKTTKLSAIPPKNEPFGSVGLTSVYYADLFRKSKDVPIFILGLDFSFSQGFTHAKGTMAHSTRLLQHNKLNPIENYAASFNPTTFKFLDKNNSTFFSTPILKSYADLFNSFFCSKKNIFDISECGITLSIPRIQQKNLCFLENFNKENSLYSEEKDETIKKTDEKMNLEESSFSSFQKNELKAYLENEKNELLKLKSLLTEKTDLQKEDLQKKITKLTTEKEYLFLHFPDGFRFEYNQSFLNRIRTEIDFFLKAF